MKNSVNKGFFTYLILFVVIAVGAVLVAGFIMMFTPGTEILGYVYTNDKSHVKLRTYEGTDTVSVKGSTVSVLDENGEEKPAINGSYFNFATLEKLVIKTNGMKVDIIYSGEEDRIDVQRKASGFGKVEDAKALIITKQLINGTFTLTAYDAKPQLTLSNNSKINVYLKLRNPNLKIEVESKTAGLSAAINNFNQSTTRDLTLKSLSFTTEKGSLKVSQNAEIKESLIVKSTIKSNITIEANLGAAVALKKVGFNVAEGKLTAKNINTEQMELKGDNTFVNFAKVYVGVGEVPGILNFELKRGDFKVSEFEGDIADQNEVVENVAFSIKKIKGSFTLGKTDIKKANKANVEIDEISGKIHIKTSNGDVKIKSGTKQALIETYSGSVYYKVAAASNEKFDIKTNSGDIKLLLDTVYGKNTVASEGGNVTVYYKNSLQNFTIKALAKGTVSFPLDNINQNDKEVMGYPSPNEQAPTSPHVLRLEIETNSNITVTPVKTTEWKLIV